jgi:hypothetical protein
MESTFKFKRATLLSTDEAESLLTKKEKAYHDWWWLRSPGMYQHYAANVTSGGSVNYYGDRVNYVYDCVRPALIINLKSSNYKIGDTFKFGNKAFKIISDNSAFCLEDIGTHCFREDPEAPDANDYDASDVKKFIDAWFEKTLKEESEV